MSEQEVVELMKSSKSSDEWNSNVDKVKKAYDGYPSFWYSAIVISKLMAKVSARWGGDDKIHIIR